MPEPALCSAWREVLVVGWTRLERGTRLLEWLRLGTLAARCYACDAAATGLAARHDHSERGWVLGCNYHRTPPWRWYKRALDLGLDPVPVLDRPAEQDALEQDALERAEAELATALLQDDFDVARVNELELRRRRLALGFEGEVDHG